MSGNAVSDGLYPTQSNRRDGTRFTQPHAVNAPQVFLSGGWWTLEMLRASIWQLGYDLVPRKEKSE